MSTSGERIIAVIGATGRQGGAAVRALRAGGLFRARAITRNPDKHRGIADEVLAGDLDQPETLRRAFERAHGVFLVTNFWEPGADELAQAGAAVSAASDAGVKHLVWSTVPDEDAIKNGNFDVPHFTGKASVDRLVSGTGFDYHTFVVAPFYYQNFLGSLAPQKQADGSFGWALPIDPSAPVIHMGDIEELGAVVAGAFAHPDLAGHGEYLPLVGDLLSFNDVIETLAQLGHRFTFKQLAPQVYAGMYPGAYEVAEMFRYFEAHTYLGSYSADEVALANEIAAQQPTRFAVWARKNFRLTAGASRDGSD